MFSFLSCTCLGVMMIVCRIVHILFRTPDSREIAKGNGSAGYNLDVVGVRLEQR
jgi:hypothetical protein